MLIVISEKLFFFKNLCRIENWDGLYFGKSITWQVNNHENFFARILSYFVKKVLKY